MRNGFVWWSLAATLAMPGFPAGRTSPLTSSTQIIVVTTQNWNAVDGKLRMFQRASADGPWKPAGVPVSIVVGKGGMGWGEGVMPMDSERDPGDPVKREGDHRSPAGIFRLGESFGYAADKPDAWKMPYLPLSESTYCVDDPDSRFYNRVIDSSTVTTDWKSAEHMRDVGEAYRWGVVINHNADPTRPREGSCVFLHIWDGPGHGTEGCTAISEEQILSILGRLDPSDHPLLVQMPMQQYQRLAESLRLPVLPSPIRP